MASFRQTGKGLATGKPKDGNQQMAQLSSSISLGGCLKDLQDRPNNREGYKFLENNVIGSD